MCNYCQTGFVLSNSCGYTPRWRVQRICYDCQGNIHVVVSNGCVCRRLTCGVGHGNLWTGEVNTTQTHSNGCCGCCASNTTQTNGNGYNGCSATRFACAQNAVTAQNTDSYYERLYGSYSCGNGRGCCGGYTAL